MEEFEQLRTHIDFSDGHCQIFLICSDLPDLIKFMKENLRDVLPDFQVVPSAIDPEELRNKLSQRGTQCPDQKEGFFLDFRKKTGFSGSNREGALLALQYTRNNFYDKKNNLVLFIVLDTDGGPELNSAIPDFFR